MKHKNGLIAAAGLACLLSAYLLFQSLVADSQPKVGELLYAPDLSTSHRLYPGTLDKDGKPVSTIDQVIDALSPEGVPFRRYVTYKDGSAEQIEMQPDGRRPKSSKMYFNIQPGQDALRMRFFRIYAADGVDVVFEDLRRFSGLRERSTVVDNDGLRSIIDFAEDGKTHLREQRIAPPECCPTEPVVLLDIRYRDDATHSVSYHNTYDAKSRRRTVVELDEKGHTLRAIDTDRQATISGSKLEVFDPQSLKLRFKGEGSWSSNTFTFFRDDGTVERIEEMGSYMLTIKYFDKTGVKLLRTDSWFHSESDVVKNDAKANYRPYNLISMDSNGKPAHRLWFQRDKLVMDAYYNVTEGGVTYAEKQFHYTDDGFLVKVDYIQKDAKDKDVVVRSIEHKVTEGIRPNVDPASIVLPSREPLMGTLIPPAADGP